MQFSPPPRLEHQWLPRVHLHLPLLAKVWGLRLQPRSVWNTPGNIRNIQKLTNITLEIVIVTLVPSLIEGLRAVQGLQVVPVFLYRYSMNI